MIRSFLLVGAGGAAGSMLRYGIALLNDKWFPVALPAGTFVVNVLGSFLIGVFFGLAERHFWMQGNLYLLLATGFCGGFTTFSAFALETAGLARTGFFPATIYAGLSLFFSLLLCQLGLSIAR